MESRARACQLVDAHPRILALQISVLHEGLLKFDTSDCGYDPMSNAVVTPYLADTAKHFLKQQKSPAVQVKVIFEPLRSPFILTMHMSVNEPGSKILLFALI